MILPYSMSGFRMSDNALPPEATPPSAGLRYYQQELLDQAEAACSPLMRGSCSNSPPAAARLTPRGVVKAWHRDGCKVVWLTHCKELADQTRLMLEDTELPASNKISWRVGYDAPYLTKGVVIQMTQTVGRRTNRMEIWGIYRSDDLLVIDEAHYATAEGYERAIRQWPGRILG